MKNYFIQISLITQKFFMGVAGAFLMIFLTVHLNINLLLTKNDNGKSFEQAVEFMTTNPFIKIFEIVLFLAFIIHIFIGITLKIYNWTRRPVRYKKSIRSQTSFFSKYMIWTGLVIIIFLIIHFNHFFFIKLGLVELPPIASHRLDFYSMAIHLFNQPIYSWTYVILIAIMGFHFYHAFQSFFQTLGFNHGKYFNLIKIFGALYSIGISLGFIYIPLYFLYIK